MVQSPPSTSTSEPSRATNSTASATARAARTVAASLRVGLPLASTTKVSLATFPWSVTVIPALTRRSMKPAARIASGARSWPAWCVPALVAAPMTVTGRMPITASVPSQRRRRPRPR